MGFFWTNSFWKLLESLNFASFFYSVSKFTIAHVFWRRWKLWFFWKNRCFVSKKKFESFQKHWTRILSFRMPFKSYYCLCNIQTIKLWAFWKKDVFLRKNLWKTSGALFVNFYRKCVLDFHIASEYSKQWKFWLFRRNRCCFWKDPLSYKIGKSGNLLLACVSKSIIAQEIWKRSTDWDFWESRSVIRKNCLNFLKTADIANTSIKWVTNGIFAEEFSKVSNFDISWKNGWDFFGKKAWSFLKIE